MQLRNTIYVLIFFSDFDENPEKLMVKGRHVIIVYTPDFIENCSETDILLMRRYYKMFNKNKQLVLYICTRPTLEKLKTRLGFSCIFRLKTIQYPELGNTEAIRMFCEKFQAIFAKDNCCREDTFRTIQDV